MNEPHSYVEDKADLKSEKHQFIHVATNIWKCRYEKYLFKVGLLPNWCKNEIIFQYQFIPFP